MTLPISWKEYCPNPCVPKLLTVQDLIQYHANLEAEATVELPVTPTPKFEKVKKDKWTVASAYAFSKGIVMGLRP